MQKLSNDLNAYTQEFVSLIEQLVEENDTENATSCRRAFRSFIDAKSTLVRPLDLEEWKTKLIKEGKV